MEADSASSAVKKAHYRGGGEIRIRHQSFPRTLFFVKSQHLSPHPPRLRHLGGFHDRPGPGRTSSNQLRPDAANLKALIQPSP